VPRNTPEELYNLEAEERLLGAVLLDPEGVLALPEVESLHFTDFWKKSHQRAWLIIKKLHQGGETVDVVTITDQLRAIDGVKNADRDALELYSVLDYTPTTLNVETHARIVKGYARKREAELAMSNLGAAIHSGSDFDDALTETLERLEEIRSGDTYMGWEAYTLADAYAFEDPTEHIIEGLFELPSLSIVYGAPSTFKTVLLTEAALCVAAGVPWLEPLPSSNDTTTRDTIPAATLWLDFDNGAKRMHKRVAALGRARDLDPTTVPFRYICMPSPWLDASDPTSMDRLGRYVNEEPYALVILDNLGTISGRADENSAEMATVLSNFRRIAEDTGAAIVVIHHQRKSNGMNSRPGDALRGHSSIEAALDLALHVEREPGSDLAVIKSTKTRGADVYPFGARWSYEHKPGTIELNTARFWGVEVDDTTSDHAIAETVKEIIESVPGIMKTELVNEAHEVLDVSRGRIRQQLDLLVKDNQVRTEVGKHNATLHYLV
jgi:hypothetical protein